MTSSQPNKFDVVAENVRHNEKNIDKIEGELKTLNTKIDTVAKELNARIDKAEKKFDTLSWKIIIAANVFLKYI